jgi:hypothetical protein
VRSVSLPLQTFANNPDSALAAKEGRELVTRHLMLAFSNAAEGRDADHNEWYGDRRIPELLAGAPGYAAARCYRCSEHQRSTAIPCPWRYLTIFELETDDLPATYSAADALEEAGGLTPHEGAIATDHVDWTYTELGPLLRQTDEAAARKARLGAGEHEFVILTNPTEGREDDFLRWYDAHIPEILDHYPGLTTGQLFKAPQAQRGGQAPDWEYLALYDLEAADVADYFAIEPHGLKGMTQADGALAPRPAQWVFSPIGPRVTRSEIGATTAAVAD